MAGWGGQMEKKWVYLIFLAIHAVTDMREKQIYVPVLALQAAVGIVLQICGGGMGTLSVPSCLPGLFCLGTGRLSGEKIGYGDGWMIFVSGLFLSVGQLLAQLLWAAILACFYAAVGIAVRKMERGTEIPFAPFFLLGYLGGGLYEQM